MQNHTAAQNQLCRSATLQIPTYLKQPYHLNHLSSLIHLYINLKTIEWSTKWVGLSIWDLNLIWCQTVDGMPTYSVSAKCVCNVSSAWRDQMWSDSLATATENASRLGYKHVCVNYLHVASHDYQEVIQHTHTHTSTHPLTQKIILFFLAQLPPLFQHKFKWRMKVPNITESKT